ncbi:MAG: lysostaphin resistance A-like protein [Candidatus Methylomirabilales bacterium]
MHQARNQGTTLIRESGFAPGRGDGVAEFETAQSTPVLVRRIVFVPLITYLILVVVAETVAAFGEEPVGLYLGMGIHVVLLFTLLLHASMLSGTDVGLSRFLVTFTLVPLIRILSLGLPFAPFDILEWLLLISIPLLAAAVTLMYAMKLRPRDAYLRRVGVRQVPIQAAVALSGLALGAAEFFILDPADAPWIPVLTLALFLPGAIAIGIGAGLTEELIFRGLLQPRTQEIVGKLAALFFVALVFAAMHIGFKNGYDLAFVFGVGLYFGYVVLRTENLAGVILAHGLANVALYLLMPFYF